MADTAASHLAATLTGVHHIGITTANLNTALAFWEPFLGKPARWAMVLDAPYLSRIVGYPDVSINIAFVDLPGGGVVELLDYHMVAERAANPEATANPGNIHLCLATSDAAVAWKHAVACGARPVSREGPVEIGRGPNKGARGAYLRIHDGVTLELFQPPPTEARA